MNFSTSASIFGSNLPLALATASTSHQVVSAMQRDAEIAQDFLALRVDVVKENHETVVAVAAGVADRLDEIDFALAVGGEVLDQQHALAGISLPSICAPRPKPFGFLRTYCIGRLQPVGDPGGERNAGGFAARDRVDLVAADVALDGVTAEIHHASCARRGNEISQRESL